MGLINQKNYTLSDFVAAANDSLGEDPLLGSNNEVTVQQKKPNDGDAVQKPNAQGKKEYTLQGSERPRTISANKTGVSEVITKFIEQKLHFDWFVRTADQKEANNNIRNIFLKAIKAELESRGVHGTTFKTLPKEIKDAMNLGVFGLDENDEWNTPVTTGKPLSARRIIAVKNAIDNVFGSTQSANVKDSTGILLGFFMGNATMASNKANQADRKQVSADVNNLLVELRKLDKLAESPMRNFPTVNLKMKGQNVRLEYAFDRDEKNPTKVTNRLLATVNGQTVEVPQGVKGLLFRLECEIPSNVAFYGKKTVTSFMGQIEADSQPPGYVKNDKILSYEKAADRWTPKEMSRKETFYKNVIRSVIGEKNFKSLPLSMLSLTGLRHVALSALDGAYPNAKAVNALRDEILGVGGKKDLINSEVVRELCEQTMEADLESVGKEKTVVFADQKKNEEKSKLSPEEQAKHDKAVKMHRLVGDFVQIRETWKLDKSGGKMTKDLLSDVIYDNLDAFEILLTDDSAFDSFDFDQRLKDKDDDTESKVEEKQPGVEEPKPEVEEPKPEVKDQKPEVKDQKVDVEIQEGKPQAEEQKEEPVQKGPELAPKSEVGKAEKVEAPVEEKTGVKKFRDQIDQIYKKATDSVKKLRLAEDEPENPVDNVQEKPVGEGQGSAGDKLQVKQEEQKPDAPVDGGQSQDPVNPEANDAGKAGDKPVEENKSVEEKPVEEQPGEGQPVEEKPVEKSAEQSVNQAEVKPEAGVAEPEDKEEKPTSIKEMLKKAFGGATAELRETLKANGVKASDLIKLLKMARGELRATLEKIVQLKSDIAQLKEAPTKKIAELKSANDEMRKELDGMPSSLRIAKCAAILAADEKVMKEIEEITQNQILTKDQVSRVQSLQARLLSDSDRLALKNGLNGGVISGFMTDMWLKAYDKRAEANRLDYAEGSVYKAKLQELADRKTELEGSINGNNEEINNLQQTMSGNAALIEQKEAALKAAVAEGSAILDKDKGLSAKASLLSVAVASSQGKGFFSSMAADWSEGVIYITEMLKAQTEVMVEDLSAKVDDAVTSAMETVEDVMTKAVQDAYGLSDEEMKVLLGDEDTSAGAEDVSLQQKPLWQQTLSDLAGGKAMSPRSGLGKFMLQSLLKYYRGVSDVDKRSMVASLIRNTDEKSSPGQILGALLKGAGPVMQKMMQGLPTAGMPEDLKEALADMKDSLAPIPEEIVKAQLQAIVNDSNGKIKSITVTKSLGAASVGQAFLCDMTLADGTVDRCAIKLLRPDVQNRVQREREFFEKIAAGIPGMSTTFAGDLSTILDELDLTIEARNIEKGKIYHQNPNANVKSVEIHPLVAPSANVLVLKYVEGEPLSRRLNEITASIKEIQTQIEGRTFSDEMGYVVKKSDDMIKLRKQLNGLYEELAQINNLLFDLTKMWASESIFKGGFFHGDLHAGNLMVNKVDDGNGKFHYELTVLDYGNATQLDDNEQTNVIKLLLASTGRKTDVFMDSFNALLTPEGAKAFGKIKDKLKPEIDRILKMGVASDSASRMMGVVMLVQKYGIEIPPSIYKFVKSEMRLQNCVDSVEEQMRTVMSVMKGFSFEYPMSGNFGNEFGFYDANGTLYAKIGTEVTDSKIDEALARADEFLKADGDSSTLVGNISELLDKSDAIGIASEKTDEYGNHVSEYYKFEQFGEKLLEHLGERGKDANSLSYKAYASFDEYLKLFRSVEEKYSGNRQIMGLVRDGENIREACVRVRHDYKLAQSSLKKLEEAKTKAEKELKDKYENFEIEPGSECPADATVDLQKKYDVIKKYQAALQKAETAVVDQTKKVESLKQPVDVFQEVAELDPDNDNGIFKAGMRFAEALRQWEVERLEVERTKLNEIRMESVTEGSDFFAAFGTVVTEHVGDALQRLGFIRGGKLAYAGKQVAKDEEGRADTVSETVKAIFTSDVYGFGPSVNPAYVDSLGKVIVSMTQQFAQPEKLKSIVSSREVYKNDENLKLMLDTLKFNFVEYKKRLVDSHLNDGVTVFNLSDADRRFSDTLKAREKQEKAITDQAVSEAGAIARGSDEFKDELNEYLKTASHAMNDERNAFVKHHAAVLKDKQKRFAYVGSLLYVLGGGEGAPLPGLLQSLSGIKTMAEYNRVISEIDKIDDSDFEPGDARIVKQMMRDAFEFAQFLNPESPHESLLSFVDEMGDNTTLDGVVGERSKPVIER